MKPPTARIPTIYPVNHDPTRAPVPYGRWAPQLFTQWLKNSSVEERERTLFTLDQYLHGGEHVAACVSCGLLPALLQQLHEPSSSVVRYKAADCLLHVADQPAGRHQLLNDSTLMQLSQHMYDQCDQVRLSVQRVLARLVQFPPGPRPLLQADFVPRFLRLLHAEPSDQIRLIALQTLTHLVREDPMYALAFDALDTVCPLIAHEDANMRHNALLCTYQLCVPLAGKRLALRANLLTPLTRSLEHSDQRVRGAAAANLAVLLVTAESLNSAAADAEATKPMLQRLLNMVVDTQPAHCRYQALQALTALACHPEMRRQLQETGVAHMRRACLSQDADVSRCAARALRQTLWQP